MTLRLHPSVSAQVADDAAAAQAASDAAVAAQAAAESARDLAAQSAAQVQAGDAGPSLWLDFARSYYAYQPTGGADGLPTAKPVREFTDFGSFLADINGTFTRGSTATYFDANGVLQTAAVDEPRFGYSYDAAAGVWVPGGYIAEPSRTNTILHADDFTQAAWSKIAASVTANATTGLDGAGTAQKVVEDTSTGTHYIRQVSANSIVSGQDYCLSAFVKAGERTRGELWLFNTSNGRVQVDFDLQAGTTAASAAVGGGYTPEVIGSGLIDMGNGWFRVWVAGHTDYPGYTNAYLFLADGAGADSYTGDGASGLFCDGMQLEVGSYPTSWIPTGAAAVTRAADDLSLPVGGWLRAGAGTLLARYRWDQHGGAGFAAGTRTVAALASAAGDEIDLYNRSGAAAGLYIATGGYEVAGATHSAGASGAVEAHAVAWATNDIASVLNGGTPITDATASIPTVTTLGIGRNAHNTNGAPGAMIGSVIYYPVRLTNADLQSLTS